MTLAGEQDSAVADRIAAVASASAACRMLVDRVRAHAAAFRVDAAASGLELVPPAGAGGRRNRALLKAFHPDDRRLAAFFYKRSQVPGSRDRYAYGAAVMQADAPDAARIDAWLDWTTQGFSPASRPGDLRRALPFDVPEDPGQV